MPDEPFALSTVPPALPAQDDYEAICATVMESARGRWFLQEYARRNRNADTGLVLGAIERVEGLIRGEREQQAHESFRSELLEMAKTIAVTRAEVAEISSPPQPSQTAPAAPPASDVFATAERIQDFAWAMRERGLDPSTCDQIEALAGAILSATSLRDPNDQRAHKLGEVLQYLEHRIHAMLDSGPDAVAGEDGVTHGPVAQGGNGRANGAEPGLRVVGTPVTVLELAPIPVEPTPGPPQPDPSPAPAETAGSEMPVEASDAVMGAPPEAAQASPAPVPADAPPGPSIALALPEADTVEPSPAKPAEPAPAEPAAAEPADFLLEPLPPPVIAAAPVPSDSEPTTPSTDLQAEIEQELFAAVPDEPPPPRALPVPQLRPAVVEPAFERPDPLAALKVMTDAERIALFT